MKRSVLLTIIVVLSVTIALLYSCGGEEKTTHGAKKASLAPNTNTFVGDETCASCHQAQMKAWKGSDHFHAMHKATEQTVLGDFSDVTFTQQGDRYHFFKKEGKFMVTAPGPDGQPATYQIKYTFGWTPLQQYLVDFGNGKYQVLTVAWDTQKKRWFSLYPDQKIGSDEWLHWTNGAMNWNTMCADCHSTNLQQNYIAKADSFHTTWSSINVSCESCHGPGKQHVEFMRSEESEDASIERIRQDLKLTADSSSKKIQIKQCARCHSFREKLTANYQHKGSFMDYFDPMLPHPPYYFSDGQIKREVYVFGSFLQSKMYDHNVKCTDCHNPHTLKLKKSIIDNSLCLQCHENSYSTPKHHFHQPNTKASRCVSCHMPGRYYMQIDFRRDHSLRVPRPDLSAKFGTPNACNNCHTDKSAEWAAQAIKKWYGPERDYHFSETFIKAYKKGAEAASALKKLFADTSQNPIVRATALWYLGQQPDRESVRIFRRALQSTQPLIRNSAAGAITQLPMRIKKPLLTDMLDDSVRAVRLTAIEGLAGLQAADVASKYRDAFKKALEEYKEQLRANQYFPQGQMNIGQFWQKRGNISKAIEAYRTALEKDSKFNPARINLAYLLNRQGANAKAKKLLKEVIEQQSDYGPAYYSLALLLGEQKQLDKALSYFEQAASLMPENSRVLYNWAIALQTLGQSQKAAKQYKEAIALAPTNTEYRYGICTLYIQQKQFAKALPHAQKLVELAPRNRRFQRLLGLVERKVGD